MELSLISSEDSHVNWNQKNVGVGYMLLCWKMRLRNSFTAFFDHVFAKDFSLSCFHFRLDVVCRFICLLELVSYVVFLVFAGLTYFFALAVFGLEIMASSDSRCPDFF